ncbi:TipC family immunity protein [Streptococcus dentapri]|uniref:TipC family immunity protein n=1 Tax=Streptococcus dentapri TaxID=573564 RepID=A0ABV8D335_9STRE
MRKEFKILLGIGSILFILSMIFSVHYYTHQRKIHDKSQNIFDEMYYDVSLSSTKFFTLWEPRLNKIDGISTDYRGKLNSKVPVLPLIPNVKYTYQKHYLKPNQQTAVRMAFYYPPDTMYKNGIVQFSTNWILDDRYKIGIDYYYNVKTKVLSKSFYIVKKDDILYTAANASEIVNTLKENNISKTDIYSYGDSILEKYFLKKWVASYHSYFSPNTRGWGKVEVKEVKTTSNDDLEELTSK